MMKQFREQNKINTNMFFFSVLLFIFIFFIIVLRRPDIIYNAQPWAEDGHIWLASIYNNGFLGSLILPQDGYYQTISRLTYGFALLFGLSKAALISNVIAISIRCFLLLFFLSKRMSFIDVKYRLIIVFYFLFMPNLAEGYVNITNAHWYLSLYLMFIILANKPNTKVWNIHDFVILIVSALSGPFIIFIAPCLLIKRIYERGSVLLTIKKINSFDVVMVICTLIQLISILTTSDSRSVSPLGANFLLLVDIFSFRIFWGSFFPNYLIVGLSHKTIFNVLLFLTFSILIFYFFFKSTWRFKIAVLFPILMIVFALAKPNVTSSEPQWPALLYPGVGERYFFITNFAFFCFIIFLIDKFRIKSALILIILLITISPGLLLGLSIPPVGEFGYREDINKFESMSSVKKMDIRISPRGWYMTLEKKD